MTAMIEVAISNPKRLAVKKDFSSTTELCRWLYSSFGPRTRGFIPALILSISERGFFSFTDRVVIRCKSDRHLDQEKYMELATETGALKSRRGSTTLSSDCRKILAFTRRVDKELGAPFV
jgi:hypothetical protein